MNYQKQCPHHDLLSWHQVQRFYNGLLGQTHTIFDASTIGDLMGKNKEEAFETLEDTVAKN